MAKVDLLNNVLASGDKAQWQKTAQSKKALVEAAHGDRDISTLRPVRSVQTPTEPDASWMQGIFTAPGQSRGGATPAVPSVTPVQTPELDAAVGNTPGTTGQVGFGVGADAGNSFWDNLQARLHNFGENTAASRPTVQASRSVAQAEESRDFWDKTLSALGNSGDTSLPIYQTDVGNPAADKFKESLADKSVSSLIKSGKGIVNEVGYIGQLLNQGVVQQAANDSGLANPSESNKLQLDAESLREKPIETLVDWGEKYDAEIAAKYADLTPDENVVGDIVGGITGMVPVIASNLLLPGSGMVTLFMQAAGNATESALDSGADSGHALVYGTAVGLVEVATEKMFNGLGKVGELMGMKGVGDDVVEGLIKKAVNNEAAQQAILYLAGMLGEGFEEYVSEFADRWANKWLVSTDTRTLSQTNGDAWYSFMIGSLISAVLQSTNVFKSGGNVTPEQMADIAAEIMKQAEQATTPAAAPTETGTPAAQPVTTLSFDSMSRARAQLAVEQILTRGISGLEAFQIVNSPVAKSAFESLTGRVLAGTKLEQATVITEVSRDMRQTASRSAIIEAERNYPKSTLGAATTVTSAQAPTTAQEAPGEALAPGGVVTVPSPINAPKQVLNQPDGVSGVAPAVTQNVPAAKPAVTVPNSAPANPSVQSTAPGTFDEMLQQSPGVHPVNAEGAANAQRDQNRGVTQVPTLNFQGHLTSKTASTIMNAGITPTALVTQMQEEMAKGTFSRIAYTDEAAQASSEAHIADVGWDVALAEYKADTRAGKSSKDITALGTTLFNNALTNGDMLTAMDIATRMIENRKTTAQSLQATNMLNKATPDGRLYMAMRSIDNIREQLIQKYGDKAPELKIDDTLMQEYYDALKSGDKETEKSAWHNVEQNIADQVPSTWKDKLNAWRYLSMLGNPRTHIRNIVGNAGFVPVRAMKNIIATSIESAFSLDGRTKAFLNYASSADRALINLAASDFKNMEEYIQSGGKYVDTNSAIEDMRTIFNVKPLEWLRKLNTAGLNTEDVLFSKPIYAAALASYWKANGITAQDITAGNVSAEAMSTAQLYAAKEAAKATYRDSNWFSDWVSKLGKNYQGSSPIAKAANILVEGVIPFKRTPANILARAFEYSPAGLVKGIYDMTVNIKSGKVTAAEAIDTFSAGLTGTGLLALGALLAAHGLVSGSADDDEKQSNFDKLRGSQNYSITIGNKNYTLDWLAPEALPFFVGVEVFNHFIDSGANKSWQDFTKSLTGITEPLLETSMLSSLEDLFSSIKYADGDYIGIAAKTAATSYLSQFMPTIFGQAERAFLETQREETYRYGESDVLGSSGQYALGSLFNKVPGVDYNQIPYVNAWGERTDTGNLFERIVNNFLNPAYVAKTGGSQTDAELQRLYDLGFNTVLPSRAEQSKQIRLYDSDGNVTETTHMTADEYVAFNEKAGKLAQSYIGSMVLSDFYKGLSDDEKADMIDRVYDYANQIATSEMAQGRGANYPVDTWVTNAMSSDNPLHYIEMYGMYGDTINSDRYAALVQGGMTETEAGSLYQSVSDALDGDSSHAAVLAAVTSQNLSTDKMDVALKAYLPESAYSKYYTARIAGIAPQSYADYYRIQSGYGTSQADVYAAMKHTDWTPEQKATVWAAYGWKTNYDTYAASH